MAIKYQCTRISRLSDQELFRQLDSFLSNKNVESIALYTIDFVRYILERHYFPISNVYLALETAKYAQVYSSDLALWFATDNQVDFFR